MPPELPPPAVGTRTTRARVMIGLLDDVLARVVAEPLVAAGKRPRDLALEDITAAHVKVAEIVENAPDPTLALPADDPEIERVHRQLAPPDKLPKSWREFALAVAELRARTPRFVGTSEPPDSRLA